MMTSLIFPDDSSNKKYDNETDLWMLCEDSKIYQQGSYEFKEELEILIDARKEQQR